MYSPCSSSTIEIIENYRSKFFSIFSWTIRKIFTFFSLRWKTREKNSLDEISQSYIIRSVYNSRRFGERGRIFKIGVFLQFSKKNSNFSLERIFDLTRKINRERARKWADFSTSSSASAVIVTFHFEFSLTCDPMVAVSDMKSSSRGRQRQKKKKPKGRKNSSIEWLGEGGRRFSPEREWFDDFQWQQSSRHCR